MAQESNPRIGIIGAGVSGCTVAYFLKQYGEITLIDYSTPLRTILPTGGGRCNLAYAEYDFKELAKYYPRGEKFLYSIFSKFSTFDTIEMFEELGISTYTQEDMRIFPTSNSSKNVQEAFQNTLKNINTKKEMALRIEQQDNGFKVVTDKASYVFDILIIATGGNSNYEMVARLGIDIVKPCPALVGLNTQEKFESLAGTFVNNCSSEGENGDLLFTHTGVSGPLIYKISSIKAREKFPYQLEINLHKEFIDLQNILNNNPHKQIDNLLSEILPKKLATVILNKLNIAIETKSHKINGEQRDAILDIIHNFRVKVIGTRKDGETVTAGGVNLVEVNNKTLESKKIKNLYFIGEVLDIDGFCGGFNLQNCWSTAFVASQEIINKIAKN